jgi:hypothetical protein
MNYSPSFSISDCMKTAVLLILALALQGCVGRAISTVVKAPFQIAGAAVDAVTTTQKESDLKRGRAARKQEERDAKDQKKADKEARRAAKQADDRDY